MSRSFIIAALLIALGLVAASLLLSSGPATSPMPEEARLSSLRPTPGRGFGAVRERPKPLPPRVGLEPRAPAVGRAEELAEHPRRPEGFAAGSEERAAGFADPQSPPSEHAQAQGAAHPESNAPPAGHEAAGSPESSSGGGVVIDYSQSALERALTEAGLPPAAAAEVKRRYDELAMDEVSLRNLATREGWVDTPEFTEELDEIETERLAIRDEIGDEAYDHYLFATGQPNRVYVTDVMANSPASVAGLQTSDVILSFGGARILRPDDLIAETQVGTLGEPVRVEISRNGEPLELEIPRGPLGLHIGVTQEPPSKLAR